MEFRVEGSCWSRLKADILAEGGKEAGKDVDVDGVFSRRLVATAPVHTRSSPRQPQKLRKMCKFPKESDWDLSRSLRQSSEVAKHWLAFDSCTFVKDCAYHFAYCFELCWVESRVT